MGHRSSEVSTSDEARAVGAPRSVTIVTPCYNEEHVLELFWDALRKVLDGLLEVRSRVVFVDDGSSDGTLKRLRDLAEHDSRIEVLSLARNFGHQIALSAGLDVAGGDAVILMDSDLQHPPELIPELLAQLERGAEVVSAIRQRTADASLFKRLSSDSFYILFNALSDTPLPTGAADFTCLSRRAYRTLRRMRERQRFLRAMVSWTGLPRSTVSYVAPPRAAGHSKYTLRKMVRLALDGVFAFSARPIRFGIRFGVWTASLGGVYLLYVLGMALWSAETVRGWPSILATVIIMGGLQICMIGLVGEYVARMFEQTKGRPLYVLKERIAARSSVRRTNESDENDRSPRVHPRTSRREVRSASVSVRHDTPRGDPRR